MHLDESFRMVRVPCHLEVVVKSYGQITVWENVMGKWGRNVMDYIFGGVHWTPSKAVVIFSTPSHVRVIFDYFHAWGRAVVGFFDP